MNLSSQTRPQLDQPQLSGNGQLLAGGRAGGSALGFPAHAAQQQSATLDTTMAAVSGDMDYSPAEVESLRKLWPPPAAAR
jgi:hypothetical protein